MLERRQTINTGRPLIKGYFKKNLCKDPHKYDLLFGATTLTPYQRTPSFCFQNVPGHCRHGQIY